MTAGMSGVGSRWRWFVIYGFALGVLGLVALWNVMDAALVTTVVIGWLLLIGGVMHIVGAITMRGGAWRIVNAGLGILYLLVGFNLIADPFSGAITLTLALGLLLVFDGAGRLAGAVAQRRGDSFWMALLGIVNILLGIWLWTGIPVSGLAIGFYAGVMLVVAGVTWVSLGLGARRLHDAMAHGMA
jgi:uncharacterized membrane protein HdeD (DUF308 family)